MLFIILDLERTLGNGVKTYWKHNKNGYTDDIAIAGRYTLENAIAICNDDIMGKTVMIPYREVEGKFVSETEWLGSQGDDYDKRQKASEDKFFARLLKERGFTKEKFNTFSSESKMYYFEKYGE